MPDTTLTSAELDEKVIAEVFDLMSTGDKAWLGGQLRKGIAAYLARAGLEAGKAEESMRERAAAVADQMRLVATPGKNALFGQGMANAADQISAAIRALPLTGGDKP